METQISNHMFACNVSNNLGHQAADSVAPEHSSGLENKQLVTAKEWMVTAANPIATHAGADILAKGGNAIDAWSPPS